MHKKWKRYYLMNKFGGQIVKSTDSKNVASKFRKNWSGNEPLNVWDDKKSEWVNI